MAKESPHMLFLDEPTNHLDMESIDSLAQALNNFSGGLVLVSHDMRLISQVAKEIWYCDNRTLSKFVGEINDFKMHLRRQMVKDNLIDGDSAKAAVVSKEKEKSMFVPLNPLKPPGPPAIAPLLAPPAKKDDEDPVLKARKELEALKLASKAKATEEKKQAMESALATLKKEKEASDNIDGDNVDDEDDEKSKVEEKALQKARRKAEKEAKEKFDKEQEEERERRRLEKIKDNEDAKKAKEVADVSLGTIYKAIMQQKDS
jgi:ATP-binding cassette subfamily F protein 2